MTVSPGPTPTAVPAHLLVQAPCPGVVRRGVTTPGERGRRDVGEVPPDRPPVGADAVLVNVIPGAAANEALDAPARRIKGVWTSFLRGRMTASRGDWPFALTTASARWRRLVGTGQLTSGTADRYVRALQGFRRYAEAQGVMGCAGPRLRSVGGTPTPASRRVSIPAHPPRGCVWQRYATPTGV